MGRGGTYGMGEDATLARSASCQLRRYVRGALRARRGGILAAVPVSFKRLGSVCAMGCQKRLSDEGADGKVGRCYFRAWLCSARSRVLFISVLAEPSSGSAVEAQKPTVDTVRIASMWRHPGYAHAQGSSAIFSHMHRLLAPQGW